MPLMANSYCPACQEWSSGLPGSQCKKPRPDGSSCIGRLMIRREGDAKECSDCQGVGAKDDRLCRTCKGYGIERL